MKFTYLTLTVLGLSLCFSSCKKDEDPEQVKPDPTPTATVEFQAHVLPIFNTHCNGSYCHGGGADGKYFDTHSNAVAVPSATFLGAINHSTGFEAMPKSAAKLSQGTIDTLTTWVNEGRLNN